MRAVAYSSGNDVSAVLRNTYMLLAVTLGWSAVTAYLGTMVKMGGLAYLGLVVLGFMALFATMALRNSGWGLVAVMAFTGIEGFSLGPVLNHYLGMAGGSQTIATAAALTGTAFTVLSGYVLITRKDFSFLGGMLFVGLVLLLLASMVSMIFHVPGMQLALAAVSALIFSGYILYDTSEIVHGGETNYILATVNLYLDILNLFLALLRLVGATSDE
jgi:modulator of FtsH protease